MAELELTQVPQKPLKEAASPPGTSNVFRNLFLGLVCVNVLVLMLFWPGPNGSKISGIIYFTSLVTTVELLGATAGFRFGFSVWKWIVAFVVLISITGFSCMACSSGSREFTAFLVFNFGVFLTSSLTAVLLRVLKGQLRRADLEEGPTEETQFGIRDIVVLTTAAAVFVSVGRWFSSLDGMSGNPMLWTVLVLGMALSSSLSTTLWAMFGETLKVLKFSLVLLVAGISFWVVFRFMSFGDDYFFPSVGLASQLMFFLMTFAVRKQGYRFIKKTG